MNKQSEKYIFWLGLVYKCMAGIAMGVLYQRQTAGDTWAYYHDASIMSDLALQDFGKYVSTLLGKSAVPNYLNFGNQPRAFFFVKLLSLPDILLRNYWLCSLTLSTFSFLGLWKLSKTLLKYYTIPAWVVWVALFFFPSFVFWSAGVLKESLLMGTIGIALHVFVCFIEDKRLRGTHVLVWLLSFLLIWQLKYYYAAGLYASMGAYIVTSLLTTNSKKKYVSYLTYVGVILVMLLGASFIHPNLHLADILNALHQNHQSMLSYSNPLSVIDFDFSPTLLSFLSNLPKAFFAGLYRPMLLEGHNIYYVWLGIENLFLLLLLPVSMYYWWKNGKPITLLVFASIIYILMMASLLGLSSPNFGSLSRYKVGYAVFYLMLCLGQLERK